MSIGLWDIDFNCLRLLHKCHSFSGLRRKENLSALPVALSCQRSVLRKVRDGRACRQGSETNKRQQMLVSETAPQYEPQTDRVRITYPSRTHNFEGELSCDLA